MEKFVLDTNLFFNMEPGLGLGRKTEEVVVATSGFMKKAKTQGKAEFFMPPRILSEFLSFFEDKEQPFIKGFTAQISAKSPDISKVSFPAQVFYKLVEDIRDRSYRGLNIAEEELKQAARQINGKPELAKVEFERQTGGTINKLRERYRQATRTGFLDSVADLDLIVLARELEATLVTTDEGVMDWGRTFGVKEMRAGLFGDWLKNV